MLRCVNFYNYWRYSSSYIGNDEEEKFLHDWTCMKSNKNTFIFVKSFMGFFITKIILMIDCKNIRKILKIEEI